MYVANASVMISERSSSRHSRSIRLTRFTSGPITVKSSRSLVPILQAGAALHYGTVSYGNIGAGDRLDFTVIGPDVNLTSRIEHFNRELGRTLIMSQAFTEQLDCPVWEIGHYELRGFVKRQRLFELPPDES